MMVRTIGLAALAAIGGWNLFAQLPEAEIERRVQDLLAQMTLEEKVGQLNLVGCSVIGAFDIDRAKLDKMLAEKKLTSEEHAQLAAGQPIFREEEAIAAGRVGAIAARTWEDYNTAQKVAVERSRLKIPLLSGFDVIHGKDTTFPINLAMSCTWDEEIWRKTAEIAALEARANGCNWTYAPMLDIGRDVRWGRVTEGAGQDPYLLSRFAAATVRGFQGEDMSDGRHVAACMKHYVGYGACEGGRDYNFVEMTEGTLRDIYLPPFIAAIRAGCQTVMPGFHSLNGVPCSQDKWLLTDLLQDELGFRGLVVSDSGAVKKCMVGRHGTCSDLVDAAEKCFNAGIDVDMASKAFGPHLAGLVESGKVSVARLDAAVAKMLRIKFRLGLFERPYIDRAAYEAQIDYRRHGAVAREAATRSIVLLKNDGVLPLKKGLKIALVGKTTGDVPDMQGAWSCGWKPQLFKPFLKTTIREAFEAHGVDFTFTEGYCLDWVFEPEALRKAIAEADVVVAGFGQHSSDSGEAHSYAKLELKGRQREAIEVIASCGKPFVAVLFNGRPLPVPELKEKANALVEAWHLGVAAGDAIADVLLGEVNPSGRLTCDFPNASGECPRYYNRLNTGSGPASANPWSSKYLDVPITSLYPFGYGLSYTTFAYSDERAEVTNGVVKLSCTLTNTGAREGREVVQAYIHDRVARVVRPRRELKGFKAVVLKPGEAQRVEIDIPVATLGYHVGSEYVLEDGDYRAWIAPDSDSGKELEFTVRF